MEEHGLYGRKAEEHMLLAAYHRRCCRGSEKKPELVLVTGRSGTGKSSLARTLTGPVASDGGFFVSGKFDQMQRPEPYAPFVAASSELSDQLVARDEQSLVETIRKRAQEATSLDTRLLIDTVPALEKILGSVPATKRIDSSMASGSSTLSFVDNSRNIANGTDAQKFRFLASFRGLVRAITSLEFPLVLFIDDLQWADTGSLDLLAILAEDRGRNEGFMLLGACRGNEVSVRDPLSVTLRALEAKKVTITDIHISNFSKQDVRGIMSTMFPTTENFDKLAEVLFDQTDGNIFFILQLTKRLQEKGILTADEQGKQWHLDQGRIGALVKIGNVLGTVEGFLDRLPADVQKVLRIASCLGASFRERHLNVVLPDIDVRSALIIAAEKGVVYYQAGEGKFSHDRMQEATYRLIPEDERPSIHALIGRKLLKGLSDKEIDTDIFLVVNQIGAGIEQVKESCDRSRLAELCLRAGRKAISSSGFGAAAAYLDLGIEFLGPRHWREEYYLSLALFNAAAEVEYCNANFDKTDLLLDEVFRNARCFDDKTQAYNTHVFALGAQGRFSEAIKTAFHVLQELGEPFPSKPTKIRIAIDVLKTKWMLRRKTADDIVNLANMTDPKKLSALRMMSLVYLYVFFTQQGYVPLIANRIVRRTLQYGLSGMGSAGLATYGMFLCGILGEIDQGYKYCKVALRVMEKFDTKAWLARVYVSVYGMVFPWKEPIRKTLSPLIKAHRVGCETGDIEFAMMGAALYSFNAGFAGMPISKLVDEMAVFVEEMRTYKQEAVLSLCLPQLQMYSNYMGKSNNPFVLTGEFMDEESYILTQEAAKNTTNISVIHLIRSNIYYFMNEIELAAEEAKKSRNMVINAESSIGVVTQVVYDGLIAAEMARKTRERQYIKTVRKCGKKLRKWANHSPHNFLPLCHLMEAELAALKGNVDKALIRYRRTIDLSKKECFMPFEALACERAGVTLHYFRKQKDVNEYIKRARSLYEEWGFRIKVEQLDDFWAGQERHVMSTT